MDQDISELVTIIGVVTALAVAYAKAFGSYQAAITQAFVDACSVPSRYKRVLNLSVGIVISCGMTLVGVVWLDSWRIMPAGVLAGILSAVEASKAYDAGGVGPEKKLSAAEAGD